MGYVFALLFAIVLIVGPIVSGIFGVSLGAVGFIAMGTGLLLSILIGMALVVTKLYKKTSADMAFVRTGQGGARVIKDGGCLVIPFVHEVVPVSLRTFKLEVTSEKENAMITKDKLRADIKAEFFIRVNPEKESILQASRSIGGRMANVEAVKDLVEDKLLSALRSVAAVKDLEQLNSERDEFLEEVIGIVSTDLQPNGFVLETTTISRLDQTDQVYLKDNNIFDAQGLRKIAEVTERNKTEKNRLVKEGEQARKIQDVDTKKKVLALTQDEAEATAAQNAAIRTAEAQNNQEAKENEITAVRSVELTMVSKEEAVAIAATKKQQAVQVAEQQKEAAIAKAHEQRALTEAEKAKAQALREAEDQNIVTVKVVAQAERAKQQAVIAAQATADSSFVSKQRDADAGAYETKAKAEADREAADANAFAIEREAKALANAKKDEAAGQRAVAMIPVDVSKAEVEVEADRVELEKIRVEEVLKPELEARETSGRVAQDFEIQKLQVQSDQVVRVAQASAVASVWTKADVTLYGTPDQVNDIMSSMMQGHTLANKIDSFFKGSGDGPAAKLGQVAASAVSGLADVAQLAAHVKPKDDPEVSGNGVSK